MTLTLTRPDVESQPAASREVELGQDGDRGIATTASTTSTDMEITRAVRAALELNDAVPHERIRVMVSDCWVTLHGDVVLWSQGEAAERTVRRVAGVRGCTSAITVQGRRTAPTKEQRSSRRGRNRFRIPASG